MRNNPFTSRASNARAILSLVAAFAPFAAFAKAEPPLVPGITITIPHSAGKFDFLEVDSKRRRLLAAHEKDETADILDLTSNTILARVKTGPAVGIAIDTKTGDYFVSVQDDKRIAVIDAESLTEKASITTDGETDAILFDEKDRRFYVTNDNGKFLWAIDADTKKVVAAIPIPEGPECMAYDAAADRIYLNIKGSSQIAVIDTVTNTVATLWSTAPAKGPHGLVFEAKTNRIFVSGENGKIVAIDVISGKVTATEAIVEKVDQIAFDPSTSRIYCAGPAWMSVVQATPGGLKSLGRVATAETAKNVAVDIQTHIVWTTYTDGTNSYAKSYSTP